jgi:hypothetical protein
MSSSSVPIKCRVTICYEQAIGVCYPGPIMPFCPSHSCASFQCPNPLANNNLFYCSDHECKFANCDLGRSGNQTYCNEHKCQSDLDCERAQVASVGAKVCSVHLCEYAGCYDHWHYFDDANGVKQISKYCERHTCAEQGCLEMVVYAGGETIPAYCQVHHR